jgi:dihydropyrimidinase
MVNDVSDATLAEMDTFVAEGITTFKLFTAYPGVQLSDDGAILRAMLRTADNGGLILMHAENGVAIDVIANASAEAGRRDPWHHGLSRPPGLEAECVHRVIRLAEVAHVPVYIVHLSSRDALEEVVRGRQRGARVIAETCPQYLALSIDDLGNGFEGAKFVCSPPLRPSDHQEALWQGLATDDLQVVGTDHCPFDFAGQKDLGRGDFRKIPNGLPGVEERLDLLFQGVVQGRLSVERWVEICSTAAARIFGLGDTKGVIAPGYDADIVIYDPGRRHVLSAATHHMAVDYSCYEGREVQGGSDIVLSRGQVIVEDGEYLGRPGDGRFLPRQATAARLP